MVQSAIVCSAIAAAQLSTSKSQVALLAVTGLLSGWVFLLLLVDSTAFYHSVY